MLRSVCCFYLEDKILLNMWMCTICSLSRMCVCVCGLLCEKSERRFLLLDGKDGAQLEKKGKKNISVLDFVIFLYACTFNRVLFDFKVH